MKPTLTSVDRSRSRPSRWRWAVGMLLLLSVVSIARLGSVFFPARPRTPEESHDRMVRELARIREMAPDENIYVGDLRARNLRAQVAQLTDQDEPLKRWLALYQLGKAELDLGNEREAIKQYERAYAMLPGLEQQLKVEAVRQSIFDLGVAYLRLGETQNCCRRHSPESCILPLRGEGLHSDPEGSTKAIEYFENLLRRTDATEPLHLATRWLLNLAYMTLGRHPHDVPQEYLIPIDAIKSDLEFPRLSNIAARVGLATFSLAGGAIADDFDNDGFLDLVVSTSDPAGELRVFWNQQNGTFSQETSGRNGKSGLAGIYGGLNIVQTDYNNDGWLDIFVLRGGWMANSGQHPRSLLRNNGDRTFTDITYLSGLGDVSYPSQTAGWSDYDLDGDLDLYIGNESTPQLNAPSQLFQNQGDGTFRDVAKQAGVTNGRMAKGVVWGDFDADRYPDIYVSNYQGENRLYHNQQNGTFVDVAIERNVTEPWESFPVWFWDYNNDGILDLFVSAYSGGIAEVAAFYLNAPFDRKATLPRLYRGTGDGRFQEVAEQTGFVRPMHPMGANFGDLNNDGFLDCYFGTGWPEIHELMPNVMYVSEVGERFKDVTVSAGVGHLQKGHAVVFADLDDDGDQDLFEQMGGFVPADRYHDALYENPTNRPSGSVSDQRLFIPTVSPHWISIRLQGTKTNRAAIGARIHVRVREAETSRSIYRYISSGGSFGGNPLRQTIGLGYAEAIEVLEVFWPTTGKTESYFHVPFDQSWQIVEGSGEFTRIDQSPGAKSAP